MIFAMNIVGDRATQRHKAGTRGHRQEKAARYQDFQQRIERNPGLSTQQPCSRIKGDGAVELRHVDDRAMRIETAVAIRAPQTNRENFAPGFRALSNQYGQFVLPLRMRNSVLRTQYPPP